jgi:hypothetical protein
LLERPFCLGLVYTRIFRSRKSCISHHSFFVLVGM